ncbi:glycosyltransferase [Mesorhizobium sp. BR1-1-6]|uniref:glycosyltransferase n=1 Tax=unclassified Mesorhizobium TaxID=325217 RepID=UPI001126808F|nr:MULTISPECIES: glycosyltransferase [unclassified Mesorhizobium]MBZ9896624.1 glycosyltransferase [Mesorhizobium sp. BR1-1-6]MBZ9981307.1 glycosyltransferase [Mesorhizobium sp. BR-1-1-8]TPL33702.1 glycosyltransferase family 4 protein [Mesorhizobium sp. B2-4-8]TPL52917.1 glycosyltransferase family 4 protein [Mesorhizobium sp. B2-4-2]TPL62489.1 glycosyltransferase family 4 protein [Mesorhizobium sp. B2-4-1]
MKKMGIFLGYTPRQLVPHEGITRLLGFIIRGAVNSGEIAVTVAGPGWLKTDIINLLDDAGVPPGSVDIVTTKGEPYLIKLWRIKTWFSPGAIKRPAKLKRKRVFNLLVDGVSLVVRWLSNSSIFVFLLGVVLLAFLIVIMALPVLLSAVIVAGLYAAKRLLRRVRSGRFYRAKNWLLIRWGYLLNAVGPLDTVRAAELNRLVRLLNRRRDIDVWYVPSMFWPETSKLQGKVVMAAPDIVFYEHPAQFISPSDLRAHHRISQSIAGADRLITYSDHVKATHIVNRHGVDPDHVSVIRHGFVDMASIERGDKTRRGALDILHQYMKKKEDSLPSYLNGFKFDDVKFLFYSSQVRPHKNIEGLISVFERVLREHYRPVKLVLTGRVGQVQRIRDMIDNRGLQRDVISLPAVPNHVLAALYRLSALSVTPTQFEGGFPFTFSEAYSVGTPSVMSRIPVVTELLKDRKLLDIMTFDPQDREDMLRKVLWGLDNRETLFQAQRPLFEVLSARTWSKVADEYLDLMRSVEAK